MDRKGSSFRLILMNGGGVIGMGPEGTLGHTSSKRGISRDKEGFN